MIRFDICLKHIESSETEVFDGVAEETVALEEDR